MTVENLSIATADRHETKMIHDVHSATRIRAPPRPDPPIFGRESMEDAVSARVVSPPSPDDPAPESSPTKAPASARVATIEDEMDSFFAMFQRVESQLHLHLSEDDRSRIRSALSPPSEPILQRITSDPATTAFVVAVIVTGLVIYVCSNNNVRRPTSRTFYRGDGRKEIMKWNIGRLLKPISGPR